jgi:ATP-dependent RNA helicase RhlE
MEFSSFGLHADILRGVSALGFKVPTPIQRDAIPPALSGRDVLACAMTGSGKTAAFGLPIVERLRSRPRGATRALVLSPTRELAAQIQEQIAAFGAHTPVRAASVYGGVGMGPQEAAFRRGTDVIVATPGRLLDHLQYPYARLDEVEVLVLDEADRMLDMGFLPDIRRVMAYLSKRPRQTLLFSATMPGEIVRLSRDLLRDPVAVNIERKAAPAVGITHALYPVAQERKTALLLELLRRPGIRSVLAFTRTKHRANRLADFLDRHGVSTARIHGNRSQAQRTQALDGFKAGRYRVLVATDIAARGIDIDALSHVINFDVPGQPEDYIHRVGRTARAEATGDAITLAAPDEADQVRAIERAIGRSIPRQTLAGFAYDARTAERFEVPIGERIAAIRARKAEERARSREKADRREGRVPAQRPGPAWMTPGRAAPNTARPAGPSAAPAQVVRPATATEGHVTFTPIAAAKPLRWPTGTGGGRRPKLRRR